MNGKGTFANILGKMGFSAQIQREEGTKEALKNYPDIEYVTSQTGHWNRAESMRMLKTGSKPIPN